MATAVAGEAHKALDPVARCSHAWMVSQAIEGSSALKVALDRFVSDEIAQTLGTHTGCLYTDVKEFYDYLCPVKTLKAALDFGIPAPIAVLAFPLYRDPMASRGSSMPPGTSSLVTRNPTISPGPICTLCSRSARTKFTLVQTREWVDDFVQRINGPIFRIQHHLEAAGLFVLRGLRGAGFTVSPKTTLVTTDRGLSSRLMAAFRAADFRVQCAASAADLVPPAVEFRNTRSVARVLSSMPGNFADLPRTSRARGAPDTGMLSSASNSSKLLGMAPLQVDRLRHRERDHAQERRSLPYYRHGRK